VLNPEYVLQPGLAIAPVALVAIATLVASVAGAVHVNRLDPTELLRDE
jgi:hypothetical protein